MKLSASSAARKAAMRASSTSRGSMFMALQNCASLESFERSKRSETADEELPSAGAVVVVGRELRADHVVDAGIGDRGHAFAERVFVADQAEVLGALEPQPSSLAGTFKSSSGADSSLLEGESVFQSLRDFQNFLMFSKLKEIGTRV